METETVPCEESSAFSRFAETAEAVTATMKRLEKAAALSRYFNTLEDQDLLPAARYFAGNAFSLRDQRTTSMGGAAAFTAILSVTQADDAAARARLVALGDMGNLAGELFAERAATPGVSSLCLADIAHFFETLAETTGSKKKIALLTEML